MVSNVFIDLMTKALQAEKDDNDEVQSQPPKSAPPKEKKASSKPKASTTEKCLPKYWHCPERYYNRDCEVNKV